MAQSPGAPISLARLSTDHAGISLPRLGLVGPSSVLAVMSFYQLPQDKFEVDGWMDNWLARSLAWTRADQTSLNCGALLSLHC